MSGITALIDALRKLCAEGQTGTLFLTQPDKRQARIGLLQGRIAHIALFTLRGEIAIKALSNRPPLSFSFQQGFVLEEQPGLPDSAKIIELLGGGAVFSPPAPGPAAVLPEKLLHIVAEELAYFVGPMAPILVDEERSAESIEVLLKRLGSNLTDQKEVDAFSRQVFQRLQQLG